MSVTLFLKISVITEPIGLYSSENIPTSPVVVLGYFFLGRQLNFSILPLGAKPQVAKGIAAALFYVVFITQYNLAQLP